jgi:hypothetical protein
MTGCVSPQHHYLFDDFFEKIHHIRPDVSDTICWQQLAELSCAAQTLSNLARPTQSSTVPLAVPFENRPIAIDLIGPWKVKVNGQLVEFNTLTCIDTASNLVELIRDDKKTA